MMLHDVVDEPGELSEAALVAAHLDQLADVIRTRGIGVVAEAVGLPEPALAAIVDGEHEVAVELDIGVVAGILALSDEAPDREAIVAAAREALLFGMTTGVLNVDVVAGEVTGDLDPREVQGMLEGRHPMTLRTYVSLQHVIMARSP